MPGTELGLWDRLMMSSLDQFLTQVIQYDPDLDASILSKAYTFAAEAHSGQRRESREPYINHPAIVAQHVAEMQQGTEAVAAALLHDCIEDTHIDISAISAEFGESVSSLVFGLTKISSIKIPRREMRQAEYLRRLLLGIAEDVRVIVIKLADRLHNMQTLESLEENRRKRIAIETLEIYAPLAHSLGMGFFRTQLEDLAFKELVPKSYAEIKELVSAKRTEREAEIENTIRDLKIILLSESMDVRIQGRAKHFYGIYRKILREHKKFREIWDLLGVRIITDTVENCYRALGAIHAEWNPVDGRFKDYIARPKPNMYQSIHTTVRTPAGHIVELQIRTERMHAIAEHGVAAHWRYHLEHEGGRYDLSKYLGWFNDLISTKTLETDPQSILHIFKKGLINNEVIVRTPDGELIPIRAGATGLDFAFQLHTELGLHCNGIRANGKSVPLDYQLESGDTIEVSTSPVAHPTQDWLSRVTTGGARQKIRRFLRQNERERTQAKGRTLVVKELRRASMPIPRTVSSWEAFSKTLGYPTTGELFLAVGSAKVEARSLINQSRKEEDEDTTDESPEEELPLQIRKTTQGIKLGDLRSISVRFARCCTPIPGDPIIAFITRGRGASIHRESCPNVRQTDPERLLSVQWDVGENETFLTAIQIRAGNRKHLLGELQPVVEQTDALFRSMNVSSDAEGMKIVLQLAVKNTDHLHRVRDNIKRLAGVRRVSRVSIRNVKSIVTK